MKSGDEEKNCQRRHGQLCSWQVEADVDAKLFWPLALFDNY
jgi:hypothetical protein